MGRSTSEGNFQGLRKKGKQITVQSISLPMTVESTVEGDTAKGKMGTNFSEGNIHGIGNKQTHITFYGTYGTKCLVKF